MTQEGGLAIRSISLMPDQQRLVSGASDNSIAIWDCDSAMLIKTIAPNNEFQLTFLVNVGQRLLAAGSHEGLLALWNAESCVWARSWAAHFGRVSCLAVTADERCLVSAGEDARIAIWAVESGAKLAMLVIKEYYDAKLAAISLALLGTRQPLLVSGHRDRMIKVWKLELEREQEPISIYCQSDPLISIALTPDERYLACGGCSG